MHDDRTQLADRLRPDVAAVVTREERELLAWVAKRHGWEMVNRDWESILAIGHYEGMVDSS